MEAPIFGTETALSRIRTVTRTPSHRQTYRAPALEGEPDKGAANHGAWAERIDEPMLSRNTARVNCRRRDSTLPGAFETLFVKPLASQYPGEAETHDRRRRRSSWSLEDTRRQLRAPASTAP